ncbi:unnamed protein product [Prorocentrum cordatum]|uniref:Uncharacterized protein n=1 Tax=Prorocentrum cordatum TaxID=2364126 RepID=A0ABN9WW22_9DINO|nr:unnamed protein product [Polarella glacialis]
MPCVMSMRWLLRAHIMSFVLRRALAARAIPALTVEQRANDTWQAKLAVAMRVAQDGGNTNKVKWAERWMDFRTSLDFTPWTAGLLEGTMEVPTVCASEYTLHGKTMKYPSVDVPLLGTVGGGKIYHTFMVFADQELPKHGKRGKAPKRKGCGELLQIMSQTSARTKKYAKLQEQAASLGCLSLEAVGAAESRILQALQDEFEKMSELSVRFVSNATGHEDQTAVMRVSARESRSSRSVSPTPVTQAVVEELLDWVFHSLSKYASKSGAGLWAAVRQSLERTPPKIGLKAFGDGRWEWSLRGSCAAAGDGLQDCSNWTYSIPGNIKEIQVQNETLAIILSAVEEAREVASEQDWKLLAQAPAVYAAAGFDKPGILDNGGWECDRIEAKCEVHPQCARVAAQMLAYPFGGDKKYASSWTAKATTFASSLWGGKFDSDGFHSSCHVPGGAYCWSYTDCLQEMLNWLCAQEETAGPCCPNADVATACREDVNGAGCKVCAKPESPSVQADSD